MRKTCLLSTIIIGFICIITAATAMGGERILRLSCSAQIAEAIGPRGFHAFEKASGIKVELFVCSSEAAVYRLMHGHSDIAGTSQGLPYVQGVWGYIETPICTDPIAVIVNSQLPVDNLTVHQLRMIFSGQIMRWSVLGGPDRDIMVVLPSKDTAAYKNFDRRAMRYREMRYDLMAFKSTGIIKVVAEFSNAISFISHGAAVGKASVKCIQVGKLSFDEDRYPFQQEFSFVTKGIPQDDCKTFIDYWLSKDGSMILKEKGMKPITP